MKYHTRAERVQARKEAMWKSRMNQVNIRAEKASKAFWAARDAWNEMRDKMKEMGLWNDWCEENDYTTMIEFDDLDLTGVL